MRAWTRKPHLELVERRGFLTVGLAASVALAACATEPQYPVRPGAPRAQFELPKPAYAIRPESRAPDAPPPPAATEPGRTLAPPPPPADEDTVIRREPITEAPPPPDRAPPLRGRQAPERKRAVESAPKPLLETPATATVRPGESLFELAERVRTPVQALVEANELKPPYDVTPGDVLKVPPPVVYVVKPGDSFASIGHRYAIDPRSLASLNDLAYEGALTPGQRLALPAGASVVAVARPPQPPALPKPRPSATVATLAGRTPDAAEPPPPPPPAAQAAAPSASPSGKGKFLWPVKGDILSTFGAKGPGQRNDGVNIAATEGEPVRAAAAGQVVYAGNSIPGFGNLVVVKHPDGWTSLYGNLGKMTVKIRSEVEQGQPLGVAGVSGGVDRPQVHFEVRYASSPTEKAKPVDPQTVLP